MLCDGSIAILQDMFKAVRFNISQPFLYVLALVYFSGAFSGLFARFKGKFGLQWRGCINQDMHVKWFKSACSVAIGGLFWAQIQYIFQPTL